jgi:hypothetical protein
MFTEPLAFHGNAADTLLIQLPGEEISNPTPTQNCFGSKPLHVINYAKEENILTTS